MQQRLSPDSYSTRGRPARQARRQGLTTFVLVFASCALLLLSRLDLQPVRQLRSSLAEAMAPIMGLASPPVLAAQRTVARFTAIFTVGDELERLRKENQRLRAFAWRSRQQEQRLAQLSVLARLGRDTGLELRSARVLADVNGPFRESLLIDLGTNDGIAAGFAVVTGDGLVGHVVDVGSTTSRVLLVRDGGSRIPVLVGPSAMRGILKGNGRGSAPVINNVGHGSNSTAAPRTGDDVYTSGDDGSLPRGLRIGKIQLSEGVLHVQLAARQEGLDLVGVLLYAPAALVNRGGEDKREASETPTSGRLEPTFDQGRTAPRGRP